LVRREEWALRRYLTMDALGSSPGVSVISSKAGSPSTDS
jgi:hypothetical protein